nr:exosome complex exonuclease DIS3/RRP44 [Cryptococcus depauperatus CBS 7855]
MAEKTDLRISILKRARQDDCLSLNRFMRKTVSGKVINVLRERYVRDDIPCGLEGCYLCSKLAEYRGVLPKSGYQGHLKFGQTGHWLVIDTNIILHQMDLLVALPPTLPLLIPSTTIRETRHRSLPLYNRLRQLLQDQDRLVWVWWNEERRETATVRQIHQNNVREQINDRNDRSIRQTIVFYREHLLHSIDFPPVLVLLTDDRANRNLAEEQGIVAVSTRDYVEGFESQEREMLIDLVVGGVEDTEKISTNIRRIYPDYLQEEVLVAGVKTGRYYEGNFMANTYNYLEGKVNVRSLSKPVLLTGRQNLNRAIDGDLVVVEIFPESNWKEPGLEVVDQEGESALKYDDVGDEDHGAVYNKESPQKQVRVLDTNQTVTRKSHVLPTGRVVGILKRNRRTYVCHIDKTSLSAFSSTSSAQQTVFATPVERVLPRIRMRTRQAPSLVGQKMLVTIDSWNVSSRYPDGHFVRALGAIEDKDAERESIMLEYEIPYRPFGKSIMSCLPSQGDKWTVPPKSIDSLEWRDREDLRKLPICSIDPPGCQDIDDALHAQRLPNGLIQVGVHIADVSFFVHPNTPMDSEAAARGNTVYLVDKRIDMLPGLLGTNLCSLRPAVERLAFSVIWEMTDNAEIKNVRFTKSVIKSMEAFTYEAAQIRKDDKSLNDPLTNSIRLLNTLAINLKAVRKSMGVLSLSSPELKIHLNSSESAEPINVEQKELKETNSLVEEFMLLANISVAQRVQETFPAIAVLRRHMPPPKTNFEALQDLLMKRKGMQLDVSSSKALAESLDACTVPDEPEFNTLVRIMATRCMLAAEYFCSGSVSKNQYAHYGLATPIYTHFTSPIRRYADILIHRQLAASINYTPLDPSLTSKTHIERLLNNVNRKHRSAQMAGRTSVEFFVGLSLKEWHKNTGKGDGQKRREEAFVIRTFSNGLAVFVTKLGLEGLIIFEKKLHTYDPDNYVISLPSLNTNENRVQVAVFDKIMVDLFVEKDENTQRGKVKMELVEPISSKGL